MEPPHGQTAVSMKGGLNGRARIRKDGKGREKDNHDQNPIPVPKAVTALFFCPHLFARMASFPILSASGIPALPLVTF